MFFLQVLSSFPLPVDKDCEITTQPYSAVHRRPEVGWFLIFTKAVYLYYIMYSLCLHSFFPESKCSLMWYSLFSVSMCECCFWWGIQEEQYRVGNTGDNNCLIISCYSLLSVVLTHVITGGFAGLGVQGIPTVTILRCFVKILLMIIIPSRWTKLISKW